MPRLRKGRTLSADSIRRRMGIPTGKRAMKPASLRNSATTTRDLTIPDIDHGAWSFIDQPMSPTYTPDPDWL